MRNIPLKVGFFLTSNEFQNKTKYSGIKKPPFSEKQEPDFFM